MNKRIYIGEATGFYSWHRFHDFLINNGGEIGINVEYDDLKRIEELCGDNIYTEHLLLQEYIDLVGQ